MPFIKWPLPESSLRNGRTEGGVILPLSVELPAGWGMGLMTEFDFVTDGAGGYDTEYFNTITFGHDIVGNLGGYVEFVSVGDTREPGGLAGSGGRGVHIRLQQEHPTGLRLQLRRHRFRAGLQSVPRFLISLLKTQRSTLERMP